MLPHGSIEVLSLVFTEAETGKLTYYTDCKEVGENSAIAEDSDVVVLDGLRPMTHISYDRG